ncbi:glycosyltransferase family 4 protein [Candidatus Saccharibacteria bacterium]|nr:glycosyltransferase family 4 protein [Candidatus Saccharibacteria bacterium]
MRHNSSHSDGVPGAGEKLTEPYMKYGEGVSQPATPQSAESTSSAAGSAGRQAGAVRRIVIVARESGTSTGRYVDKLIEYLHKLRPRHEIIILTKTPRVKFMREVAPDFKVMESNSREYGFGEQTGLLRQLNKLKPDLVHFSMTQQPVLYKGRAITTIHDLTTIRFDNPVKNPLIFKAKQEIYKRVIKKVAQKSHYIITPSRYVKQDVAQYANISPEKIFVTYEAADRIAVAAQAIPRLEGKQFIMYVGRATPHKNLRRLVEAFLILKKNHPDLMLALAGKLDANYRRLEAYVTSKRMADSIVFTDAVSESELKWMYMNTAAYVFPSLSEGFGLPPLEAMIHGAPVVSSNATCLPEINGQAAHYFNPSSTFDMATKISEVLSSAGLRAQLIQKGHIQAGKYSWKKMAHQTLQIYEH